MATITAAAGGGNWNANGTWVGGVQPGAGDDVVFAVTSGAVTIPTAVTADCKSLDASAYANTFTMTGTAILNIASGNGAGVALKFVAAGMTATLAATSTINFNATTTNGGTGWAIGPAGKSLPIVNFSGVGGKWLLNSSFTATGAVTLNNGTLDLATNSVPCNWPSFNSSNANARTLTLGSATITLTANTGWNTTTPTNLTVTANTATVTLTAGSANIQPGNINWNGISFVLNGGGATTINNNFTCANLSITGVASKTGSVTFSAAVTVTGTFTIAGNSITNRLLVSSSSTTNRVITAATVVASNVDLQDIGGAGAANWDLSAITGGSGDCGGTTGITLTTSAAQYRIGASSAQTLWSDATKWASSSGGVGGTGRTPLPQDDVFIDNNSTAGNVNVAIDMPRAGRTIDSTGYTVAGSFTPLVTSTGGIATSVFGSWLQTRVFNANLSAILTFAGRGNYTINLMNNSGNGITIAAPNGTYTLTRAMSTGSNLSISDGTFNDGGFQVTASTVTSSSGRTRAIVRSGAWLLTATAASSIWSVTATGLTLTDTGSMSITNVTANTRTIAGFGLTYGTLNYTIAGSTGGLVITGANTFAAINFSDATNARTLTLPASTVTVVGGWGVVGTAGKLMSVVSSTSGTAATLKRLDGIAVASDYLSIKDITAQSSGGGSGTGLWYAGTHSTDVSGNTGWTFTDPVGTAVFAGDGSLSVGVTPSLIVITGFGGSGSLTVAAMPGPVASVVFSGDGLLAANAGTPDVVAATNLTGDGLLAVTVFPAIPGSAALSGDGLLAASGLPALGGDGAFVGDGLLTVGGVPAFSVPVAFAGSGLLTVGALPALGGDGAFMGDGLLVGAGTPSVSIPVTLSGDGSLVVAGGSAALLAIASLAGSGTLTADGVAALFAGIAFTGDGQLQADVVTDMLASVDLSGDGQLLAEASVAFLELVGFSGDGQLVGLGRAAFLAATMKVYLGGVWVDKPLMVWHDDSWRGLPLYRWAADTMTWELT